MIRGSILTATVIFLAATSLVGRPARATDVQALDLSGVKLGMTVAEARAGLAAKLKKADPDVDRHIVQTPVDCATGQKLAVQSGTATMNPSIIGEAVTLFGKKKASCVGRLVEQFGTTLIEVDFASENQRWDDPRVSAITTTILSAPIAGKPDDDAPNVILMRAAIAKYGKPTVALKYPDDNVKEFVWCPDGTTPATCKNTVQYDVADPTTGQAQTDGGMTTGPVKEYIVLFAHKSRDASGMWYTSVALKDLTRYPVGNSAKHSGDTGL